MVDILFLSVVKLKYAFSFSNLFIHLYIYFKLPAVAPTSIKESLNYMRLHHPSRKPPWKKGKGGKYLYEANIVVSSNLFNCLDLFNFT